MAEVQKIASDYADVVEFAIIYIKEAHPDDEWQMGVNVSGDVVYEQPKTFEDRMELAHTFVKAMDVEMRTLVDDMSNTAMACFAAWPERMYVVDTDGRIAYKGKMGPFKFDPKELEEFLEEHY